MLFCKNESQLRRLEILHSKLLTELAAQGINAKYVEGFVIEKEKVEKPSKEITQPKRTCGGCGQTKNVIDFKNRAQKGEQCRKCLARAARKYYYRLKDATYLCLICKRKMNLSQKQMHHSNTDHAPIIMLSGLFGENTNKTGITKVKSKISEYAKLNDLDSQQVLFEVERIFRE